MEGKNFCLLEDDKCKKILRQHIAEIAVQYCLKYNQPVYIFSQSKCGVGDIPQVLRTISLETSKNIIYMYPKDSKSLLKKLLTLSDSHIPMKLIIIESLQDFGAINQNDLKFFPVVIAALHDLTNVLTKRTNATCYSIVTANAMKNVLLDIFFYRQPKMHISDEEKIKTIIDQI